VSERIRFGRPLRRFETVLIEVPAKAATSRMLARSSMEEAGPPIGTTI
jgi:hypothetical protein